MTMLLRVPTPLTGQPGKNRVVPHLSVSAGMITFATLTIKNNVYMAKYLDPKNDVVFKRIFGEHPNLLVSFLNALIPLETEQRIESVEYLPSELVPINPEGKLTIVDVRCKDNHGQYFIVEMQMVWTLRFEKRMVYNTANAYSRQLEKSGQYLSLKTVYGLGILNSNFDRETDKYYHHFRMSERDNPDKILKGLEIVLVELKKFKPATESERRIADLWLRFLNEIDGDSEKAPEDLFAATEIREAIDICEKGCYTPGELIDYEKYWEAVDREIEHMALSREEGKKEGKAEKANEVALAMLKKGFSSEDISELTGLSMEEIDELRK